MDRSSSRATRIACSRAWPSPPTRSARRRGYIYVARRVSAGGRRDCARPSPGRGARVARRRHPGHRTSASHVQHQGGRGRVRVRRGDGADRLDRGQARHAAPPPAVSRRQRASGASPRTSTTSRRSPTCPGSCANGAEAYAALGTETSKGTKVFALAGKIVRGGLVEVPMGIPLREIIYEIGGGDARRAARSRPCSSAARPGGCIPAELIDIPVDYESLTKTGAIMGSGGLVVMDDRDCMVDIARFFLSSRRTRPAASARSAGSARKRMLEILERIMRGRGHARGTSSSSRSWPRASSRVASAGWARPRPTRC